MNSESFSALVALATGKSLPRPSVKRPSQECALRPCLGSQVLPSGEAVLVGKELGIKKLVFEKSSGTETDVVVSPSLADPSAPRYASDAELLASARRRFGGSRQPVTVTPLIDAPEVPAARHTAVNLDNPDLCFDGDESIEEPEEDWEH